MPVLVEPRIKPSEHDQDSEKIFKHKFGLLNWVEDLATSHRPAWSWACRAMPCYRCRNAVRAL
jgi:hypothetical protein